MRKNSDLWDHCGRGSMFTWCSIALPIGILTRDATECSSKHHLDAAACFGLATLIIPNGREGRFRLSPKTCPKTGLGELSRGITAGARRPRNEQSKTTPYWLSVALEKVFGLTSTRTTMYVACARVGNESRFLGHQPLHLSVRGLRGALQGRRAASFQDARPGRSTADIHTHAG